MQTLRQIAFTRLAHDNDLLAVLPIPAFIQRLIDFYRKEYTEFRRLYDLNAKHPRIPLRCFAPNDRLRFDPEATIRSLRDVLSSVQFFRLCANYALAEEARDTWIRITQMERNNLMGLSGLQVSAVQAEAWFLAAELKNAQLPANHDPFWHYVCATTYCAKRGWQFAMERNFDRFSFKKQIFDEKAIECCLFAVKYGHTHVLLHLLRSPKFENSFLRPETFSAPCRLFSLLDLPWHPDMVDEMLVASLLSLSYERSEVRDFTRNLFDWCLEDDYRSLRVFVLSRIHDAELKEKAIRGLDMLLL